MLAVKNKVIIIGSPGSGKSTFSRALRDISGHPLWHLDQLYWRADGTHIEKCEFRSKLQEVLLTARWIIDGNYNGTMEERIQACEQIFFLDFPTEICIEGIRARVGQKHSDLPWIEHTLDTSFLDFVSAFPKESKPKILALIDKYPEKEVLVFHSREEIEGFLSKLREQKAAQ